MENKIYATCNYPNRTWDIKEDGFYPGSFNVVMNIVYDNTTEIRSVNYGVKFYIEDVLVGEESFPKERMAINTLTSGFSVEPSFDLEFMKDHKLYLWAEVNGDLVEKEIFVKQVMPIQPGRNWKFKNGEWVPPIPKPDGIFSWNETTQQWDNEEHLYDPGTGGSTTDPNLNKK